MRKKGISLLMMLAMGAPMVGQTIAEKKESFARPSAGINPEVEEELFIVNETLAERRRYLETLYAQVNALFDMGADDEEYAPLLEEISHVRADIASTQALWREEASGLLQGESYALWHQPNTTLHQVVMDYGAQNFLYIVPPEIGAMRLGMSSNLPIPVEAWGESLELILSQYGVGVRQLNPYVRQLYMVRQDQTGLKAITDDEKVLSRLPGSERVCFVVSPTSPDPRSELTFLEKFSNPAVTRIEMIGGQIFVVSSVDRVRELLKLYDFVKDGGTTQDYQLVSLGKTETKEMEGILKAAFFASKRELSTLKILPVGSSLFLSGSKDDVAKAIKLVRDVEDQVEDPKEKTVFWYTVKHSEAEDLANVLARVYDHLVSGDVGSASEGIAKVAKEKKGDNLPVSTSMIRPGKKRKSHKTADGQNNFIVDAKTGSIIMVVEQEALPKIKDLLTRLDVPKKMVQIEVLLFEKKVNNQNNFGLNLLRLGSNLASNVNATSLGWNTIAPGSGILEFFVSRSKSSSGIPAYDLAYNFLLGQEDVQINASPSVTTVNQTPATIAIVEEISINTGANKDNKEMFSRAQYGITIEITPTINFGDASEDEMQFVTLDTDITFDTTNKSKSDRPDVTRRHIKNHVRIADGETVILGGLRRKSTQDSKESIPFLGEIPGLGKLFSQTGMNDSSTEMFVFITPKIINDPIEDTERLKREALKKRPGDVPEFVHEVMAAKEKARKKLFEGTLTTLFGRQQGITTTTQSRELLEEYDGR